MIIAILAAYGLVLGSFVNALVWRIHEQSEEAEKKRPSTKRLKTLSISQGRSMCTNCGHVLGAKDLVPVLSWVSLGGKCRYCKKPVSAQYPAVELATALLFVATYVWWPYPLTAGEVAIFGLWLVLLVGFMALLIYDLRWMLLPNRIVYPLTALAAVLALVTISQSPDPGRAVVDTALAVLVGSGFFYALYQMSDGKWIGGGDVRLGWVLGLALGTPALAALNIFIAALLGSIVSVPMLISKRLKGKSVVPFGPFLIVGAIVAQLFGASMIAWYKRTLLGL